MKRFTKGFMDRSITKISEKINEFAERNYCHIESINVVCSNTDAPIIEAIVLFEKFNSNHEIKD